MSNMFLNIVSTFKGDGIAAATRQLGAFGSAAGGLGSTLGKVGGILAGFGIAAKAVQFTNQSIDSARDLERNMYSLNTIFDEMAPQMESFAKNAYNIGLSQKDAAKASTFLGSVLKQSGFSMADTTKETQKLVSLGVDLAATYGYDVQEALLGMTALFRGEYDPIEKFGVAMKQSEINSELAARGLNNLTGAARRNAEQVIRMELLYQRAADATGAFTGQSGNLFVEQKKLQAQFENMQASIGTDLLPVMGALVEALVPLVDYIGPKIAQAVEDSLPALESFTDLIKDMSDKTTTTGKTVDFMLDSFGKLFSFVAANFGVLTQLALLIGGVTIAVQAYTAAAAFALANPFTAALAVIVTVLGGAFIIGANGASQLVEQNKLIAKTGVATNNVLEKTGEVSGYVGGKFGYAASQAKNLEAAMKKIPNVKLEADTRNSELSKYLNFLSGKAAEAKPVSISTGLDTSEGGGKSAAEKAAKELEDALEEAAKKEAERLKKREDAYKSFADSVKSIFGGIKDSILSAFSLPELGTSVNSITKNIKKLLERTKAFAANITTLSQQGLTNDLLQQVIAAGPMEGGKLAQALAGAGSSFIGELNQAYGQFGSIASEIAGVGAQSAFSNQEVVNNYYQIEVNGGVGSGPTIGKAIVDAIKSYERTSGAVWQGAS
jgi:hypothetical protein